MIALSIEPDNSHIVVGAPMRVATSSTQVALAQADAPDRCAVYGLVSAMAATDGSDPLDRVGICTAGALYATREDWRAVLADGSAALVTGTTYYLDAWTPGRLTRHQPRLPGQWIVEIGRATSPEVLRVDIKKPVMIPPWYPFELVTFDPTTIEESPWNRSDTEWSGAFIAVTADGSPFVNELGSGGIALLSMGDVRPPKDRYRSDAWGNARPADYVDRVLAHCDASHDYLELVAGVALLKDGRYVSWESSVDVTGSGFHADAYGGDADIFLSASARGAWLAISEKTRGTLRFATLPSEEAITNVLHDRYLELRIDKRPWTQIPTAVDTSTTLQGELAPDGSDGDGNAGVSAPLGQTYVQFRSGVSTLWIMTHDGWQTPEAITASKITAARAELVRIAAASGEFGKLVAPRVDDPDLYWRAVAMERRAREGRHGLTTKAGLGMGGWSWEWLADCVRPEDAVAHLAARGAKVTEGLRP